MDTFVRNLQQSKSRNDQDVLNRRKPRDYDLLDAKLFINGYRFYEDRDKHPVDANSILVHHNWIIGDARKWERANAFDCIVKNDTSRKWFSNMLSIENIRSLFGMFRHLKFINLETFLLNCVNYFSKILITEWFNHCKG